MLWRDEGIVLLVKRHGESHAIVTLFTFEHGLVVGFLRGGSGRKTAGSLQIGAIMQVEWSARLPDQMGTIRLELLHHPAASCLNDPLRLVALRSCCDLLAVALPAYHLYPILYQHTRELMWAYQQKQDWPRLYCLWEMTLLHQLGFGLDLNACAMGGDKNDLAFVSPITGRAASAQKAAPWADRLLILPKIFTSDALWNPKDVHACLHLTGHFLQMWVVPALNLYGLPLSRQQLVAFYQKEV